MKKYLKGLFWGCIGAAFLSAGICFVTKLIDPGYGYSRNKEFMDEGETYDILFFGNSHAAHAVYPMELWHNYGMASYNLAGFGIPLPATYWVIKNALDYAQPKMVVVDCYSIGREDKTGKKEMLHASLDAIPLNAKKVRMIRDLVDDPKERLEFYWDFTVYHDRWWDLDQADFEKSMGLEKGAQIAVDVAPPEEMAREPDKFIGKETVGTAYLRRIIEECQSRGIDVLLTYIPFPASEEAWQEAMCAERIAKEYGVSYINFLDLQVVDLESDCADKDSHLNGSGGRKVTEYIGQYIEKHYDIPDHRGEDAYAEWDDDYRRYTDYKIDTMRNLQSLDKYLMMCSDPAFSCYIYVDGDADIWKQNEMYLPLFGNLLGGKTDKLEEAAASGSSYFLVLDNQKGSRRESVGEEGLFDVEEKDSVAVQITVVNGQDGVIVDNKRFDNRLNQF